ncbi:hypothetical protein RIF29_24922 [Crotalaria pallida]|uniref:Peptidase A2 domain-containing protein n=1 Tax=Crotalaria pallida TaxID=3830 RepID=A0AAN9ELC3_CROPI
MQCWSILNLNVAVAPCALLFFGVASYPLHWRHLWGTVNFDSHPPSEDDKTRSERGGEKRVGRRRYIGQIHAQKASKRVKRETTIPLSFDDNDYDMLVITATIGNYIVRRMLVDQGSSIDVIFKPLLKSLGLKRSDLSPVLGPLVGFTGDKIVPLGRICLPVSMGAGPFALSRW